MNLRRKIVFWIHLVCSSCRVFTMWEFWGKFEVIWNLVENQIWSCKGYGYFLHFNSSLIWSPMHVSNLKFWISKMICMFLFTSWSSSTTPKRLLMCKMKAMRDEFFIKRFVWVVDSWQSTCKVASTFHKSWHCCWDCNPLAFVSLK